MKMKLEKDVQIKNKRATFEYTLMDRYECGMLLMGSEIKSIRQAKASIMEAYCFVHNEEVWVKNMNISEYKEASLNNHFPKRDRKLLLRKNEIEKIISKLTNYQFQVEILMKNAHLQWILERSILKRKIIKWLFHTT